MIGTVALIAIAFTPIGIFGRITATEVVTIVSEGAKRKFYND